MVYLSDKKREIPINLFDGGHDFPDVHITYSISESTQGRTGGRLNDDLSNGKLVAQGNDNHSGIFGFSDTALFTFLCGHRDDDITLKMKKTLLYPHHKYKGLIIDHRNLDVYLATPKLFSKDQRIKRRDMNLMPGAINIRFICKYFNTIEVPAWENRVDEDKDYDEDDFYKIWHDETIKDISSCCMTHFRPFALTLREAREVMLFYEREIGRKDLMRQLEIRFSRVSFDGFDDGYLRINEDFDL